jgi:hypothetical protein
MLIYLKKARPIRPIEIDKRGFGMQAAWLCVESIEGLKRESNRPLDSSTGIAL